jgi:hypothetical protein
MRERCLTDEEMSAYVDGVVDTDLRARIEEHLSECAVCLHHVAELKELVTAQMALPGVPTAEALSRAEEIIAQYTHEIRGFDIAVSLRDGLCKLLQTTGEIVTPRRLSLEPVRGDGRAELIPRVAKSIAGYLVTAELLPHKGSVVPRLTIVQEATSNKPDGIRIKLYSPGACETKYTEGGKAAFAPVGPGQYTIEIEDIGTIDLDVT